MLNNNKKDKIVDKGEIDKKEKMQEVVILNNFHQTTPDTIYSFLK